MKDPPYRKTRETYNTPGEAHELTFTCYKYRKFLSRDRTRQYFIASMQRARRKHGFHLWAYVIMPEHVHMIVYPPQDEYDVSVILKSIKLSVAKKAMNYLRRHNPKGLRYLETGMAGAPHAFWMDGGGYDRNIIRRETLGFMVNYTHNNPVRRGLVTLPEAWWWSSAGEWEEAGSGPLRLDLDSYPHQGPG